MGTISVSSSGAACVTSSSDSGVVAQVQNVFVPVTFGYTIAAVPSVPVTLDVSVADSQVLSLSYVIGSGKSLSWTRSGAAVLASYATSLE